MSGAGAANGRGWLIPLQSDLPKRSDVKGGNFANSCRKRKILQRLPKFRRENFRQPINLARIKKFVIALTALAVRQL